MFRSDLRINRQARGSAKSKLTVWIISWMIHHSATRLFEINSYIGNVKINKLVSFLNKFHVELVKDK